MAATNLHVTVDIREHLTPAHMAKESPCSLGCGS
jgi:hypothetical protein